MQSFSGPRLAVVSLHTHHLSETVHFYSDIIGLKSLTHHGRRPAFELGENQFLVLVESAGVPARSSDPLEFPALAFAVEKLEQAVQTLEHNQVELPWGIERDQHNRWVRFYDPGGNLIELAEFGG